MKRIGLLITALLMLALAAPVVYAENGTHGKSKGHHDGEKNMFCMKAAMICKNSDELGLSKEQVENIEALKSATEKDLIRSKSEIEIIGIDLKTEMRKDKIDTEAVYKLIDKKYDLKKEKAKLIVAAIVKLKETLTEEQKEKLKTLCKSSPWHKGNKGHGDQKASKDKETE